jgi:hypothetical protein
MGKGGARIKTIKSKNLLGDEEKDLSSIFGQLFGEANNMDFEVAMDKLSKLRSNVSRVSKFLESFSKTIYGKILPNLNGYTDTSISLYKKNISGFVEDCKIISEWSEFGKTPTEVINFYRQSKENKVVKDCISMCRQLIKYKKNIEKGDDNSDISGDFLKSSKVKDLQLFTFCDFDIKYLYVYGGADESTKKYIILFLSMMLKSTKEIFEVITSPDIDINKVSHIVVSVIAKTKKMLPRCSKAFSKLESSMDLLKNNFSEYYKDFVSTKDQSTIISSFISDCMKEEVDKAETTSGKMDLELTRQFMEITNFFRKQHAGKIKDPAINNILEFLDKQFKSLEDLEEDVMTDDDSTQVDS